MESTTTVKLSNSKEVAIIDKSSFDLIKDINWSIDYKGYAIGWNKVTKKSVAMHRLINNTPPKLDTDHINGNKLDNRKYNLRTATRSLNVINNSRLKNKGVDYIKAQKKWRARFQERHLGVFNTREEAILVHSRELGKYYHG
jgi:hypothetical protein